MLNTNCRSVLYNNDDVGESFCPDTGSPICLIAKSVLQKRFPLLEVFIAPFNLGVSLSSIG